MAGQRHGERAPERRRSGTVRVCDLVPGDLVDNGAGMSATLLGWSSPHPRYPGLALVLWRMHHEAGFSVDALHPEQEVGELVERDDEQRYTAITAALPYDTSQERTTTMTTDATVRRSREGRATTNRRRRPGQHLVSAQRRRRHADDPDR